MQIVAFLFLICLFSLPQKTNADCLKDPRFIYTPNAYCHHGLGIYDEQGARLKLDNCHSQCVSHEPDSILNSAADIPFEKQRTYEATHDSTLGDDVEQFKKKISGQAIPTGASSRRIQGKEAKMNEMLLKMMKEMHACCCKGAGAAKKSAFSDSQFQRRETGEESSSDEDEETDDEESFDFTNASKSLSGKKKRKRQQRKSREDFEEDFLESDENESSPFSDETDEFLKQKGGSKANGGKSKGRTNGKRNSRSASHSGVESGKKPTEEDVERLKEDLVKLYKEYSKFKQYGLADEPFENFSTNIVYDEQCEEAKNEYHNLCAKSPKARKLRQKLRKRRRAQRKALEESEEQETPEEQQEKPKGKKEKKRFTSKSENDSTSSEKPKEHDSASNEKSKEHDSNSSEKLLEKETKILETLTASQTKLTEQIAQLTQSTKDFFERCKCSEKENTQKIDEIKDAIDLNLTAAATNSTANEKLQENSTSASLAAKSPKKRQKKKDNYKCDTIKRETKEKFLKMHLNSLGNLKDIPEEQVAELMLINKSTLNPTDVGIMKDFVGNSRSKGHPEIAKAFTANKSANLKQAMSDALSKNSSVSKDLENKLIFMLKDESFQKVTVNELAVAIAEFIKIIKDATSASASEGKKMTFSQFLDRLKANDVLKELLPSSEQQVSTSKATELDSRELGGNLTLGALLWDISNRYALNSQARCMLRNGFFNFLGWMSFYQGISPEAVPQASESSSSKHHEHHEDDQSLTDLSETFLSHREDE